MVKQVLQVPDPRLRVPSQPIDVISDDVKRLSTLMRETLRREGGIGLAAPQIGEHVRLIVICGQADPDGVMVTFVNPVIVDQRGSRIEEEACLSVPNRKGFVERAAWVRVRGRSVRTGRRLMYECSGLEAACVQHEIDHLDGILFIDRLTDVGS